MRTTKYFSFEEPELDPDLFDELYSILRVSICRGNQSQVAKLLGISRMTAIRWETKPPRHHWWTEVLFVMIDRLSDQMVASGNKQHRQFGYRAKREIQPFRRQRYSPEGKEIEQAEAPNNARRHILHLLGKHSEISTEMMRKARYQGGYSQRTLREALKSLELDKETRGFGEDKVTYYRLPDSSE